MRKMTNLILTRTSPFDARESEIELNSSLHLNNKRTIFYKARTYSPRDISLKIFAILIRLLEIFRINLESWKNHSRHVLFPRSRSWLCASSLTLRKRSLMKTVTCKQGTLLSLFPLCFYSAFPPLPKVFLAWLCSPFATVDFPQELSKRRRYKRTRCLLFNLRFLRMYNRRLMTRVIYTY